MDAYPTLSGANCSQVNLTNKTCFRFSSRDFEAIFGTKVGVAGLAVFACCVAILLIFISKAYKRFVHRLTFYLAFAALLYSVVFILQILPVEDRCGFMVVRNEQFCMAAGFLVLYGGWVMLFFICWITLHLFILAVFKRNYKSWKYEVGGLIVCHSCPLMVCVVPFINFKHGVMYGLAGAWCWIKVTGNSCHPYGEGVIEQFTLWYGPLIFIVLLIFLVIAIMIIALYRGTRERSGELSTTYQLQSQYREALKETMPLLFYPIIYNILCCLAFANRVYYAATNKASFPLWIIHAIADPSLPLFIPVAFLFHPYTLKKIKRAATKQLTRDSQASGTFFVVSEEDVCKNGEDTKLIVSQSDVTTSGYQSILF